MLYRYDGQHLQDCLYRLGKIREDKESGITWMDIANFMNKEFKPNDPKDESVWRKRYKSIKRNFKDENGIIVDQDDVSEAARHSFIEIQKRRTRLRDERNKLKKQLRAQARKDNTLELIAENIERITPLSLAEILSPSTAETFKANDKAMVCMLSDLHYGISFSTPYNSFNTQLAKTRIEKYANAIIKRANETNVTSKCCVVMMGDMVSGGIHEVIKLENTQNLVSQIINASQLVSNFIAKLSAAFDSVEVYSVGGNHSRILPAEEDCPRNERMDDLIPWYAKARLGSLENVKFIANTIDPTIISFELFEKNYVGVHGDMDNDTHTSAQRIADLTGNKVDVFLSGHKHVGAARYENTFFIQNGSVCGSGDDYTAKKRLFGPPTQTFMSCSKDGVEAIYVVDLKD